MGILVDLATYRRRRVERAARRPASDAEILGELLARIERLRPLVLRAEVAKNARLQTDLLAAIGAAASGLFDEASRRVDRLASRLEAAAARVERDR